MSSPTVVVTGVPRTGLDAIERLRGFGVSTIHEAQGRTGLMASYLRPIYPAVKLAGSALTVLAHPGDNTMLHVAASVCQPGDVIVVAVSSPNSDGMLGELLATSFRAHGAAGVVIDAGCRDVAALAEMRFPVWSKAISAKGTAKGTLGSINIPVVCAGALVQPGDAIVADDDGVVVVPRARVEEVIRASAARDQKEETVRARLACGELGLDIYGMREKLQQSGLVFVDASRTSESTA